MWRLVRGGLPSEEYLNDALIDLYLKFTHLHKQSDIAVEVDPRSIWAVYRAEPAPLLLVVVADAHTELAMARVLHLAAPAVAALLVRGLLRDGPACALGAGGIPAHPRGQNG